MLDCDLALTNIQEERKHAREIERRLERDRALRFAERILSESEMIRLEESGKLIKLRVMGKINPIDFELVSQKSIEMAQNEHRLALAELFDAEEK